MRAWKWAGNSRRWQRRALEGCGTHIRKRRLIYDDSGTYGMIPVTSGPDAGNRSGPDRERRCRGANADLMEAGAPSRQGHGCLYTGAGAPCADTGDRPPHRGAARFASNAALARDRREEETERPSRTPQIETDR